MKSEVLSSDGHRRPCRKVDVISWTVKPECEPSDQASHTCERVSALPGDGTQLRLAR